MKLIIPFISWFLRYKSWLVIRPGLLAGGCVGGWTTPLTGSMWGSSLGGARSTLISAVLVSVFSAFMFSTEVELWLLMEILRISFYTKFQKSRLFPNCTKNCEKMPKNQSSQIKLTKSGNTEFWFFFSMYL